MNRILINLQIAIKNTDISKLSKNELDHFNQFKANYAKILNSSNAKNFNYQNLNLIKPDSLISIIASTYFYKNRKNFVLYEEKTQSFIESKDFNTEFIPSWPYQPRTWLQQATGTPAQPYNTSIAKELKNNTL